MHNKNRYSPINNNESKYTNIVKLFSRFSKNCSIVIFIVIYYLFFLSLEGCFEGEKKCSKKSKWIKKKLNEGLCSSFLLSFLFELMVQKLISKYHLIHVIAVFISFYIYSHGLEFDDHGLFNLLSLISLLIIVYIFFI